MLRLTKAYRLFYSRIDVKSGDVSECSVYVISKSSFEPLIQEFSRMGEFSGHSYVINDQHRLINAKSKLVFIPPEKPVFDHQLRARLNY